MSAQVLTPRHLNRALLARQLLLERSTRSIPDAIDQVGGLQTQYAPSGYVGLWSRLADFERDTLTRAIEDRSVIQATLLRGTIHMVSRAEFWSYALGVRRARRDWWLRLGGATRSEADVHAAAERLREALAAGPRTVKELGDLATGFLGNLGLFVDLVRVPPSGTWERRRADRLWLAEEWVGPPEGGERDAIEHLVRAYLRGFGPATWKDISLWAGVPVTALKEAAAQLDLVRHRDEAGRELVDLPGQPLPLPDTPAPVRFLPHWDANLLVHARRAGILPEEYRSRVFSTKNPFSVGTVLVDGRVVAAWSVRDGRVVLDRYEPLTGEQEVEVEAERAGSRNVPPVTTALPKPVVPGTKRCPKVILEGTRMTHKTDLAFALNEHPRVMGPRKYRYHGPLVSGEWGAFTAEPWGRGLIDYEPDQEAMAMETYRTWLRLMQLQRHYSWVVDRFHISTIHYQETHGRHVDLDWLDAAMAELGFRLLLCTRRPDTFAAAREERLKVSGMPSQYDDLDRFAREQERYRELCERSRMPMLELDMTDGDLDGACVATAEWLEATDGMWCR